MSEQNAETGPQATPTNPHELLTWLQVASRVLIGTQFLIVGVAAAARAVFLASFDLSLGEVGESTTDWLQRLILWPVQFGLAVGVYLSLTVPIALWYATERIYGASKPSDWVAYELSNDTQASNRKLRQLSKNKRWAAFRNRVLTMTLCGAHFAGFRRARIAGFFAPFAGATLIIALVGSTGALDADLVLLLLILSLGVSFLVITLAVLALDNTDIPYQWRKYVDGNRSLTLELTETVLPPGILLFPLIIFVGLPQLPFTAALNAALNSLNEGDLCILIIVMGFLIHGIYLASNWLSRRNASKSGNRARSGLRRAWPVMLPPVFIVFLVYAYANLYSDFAESALERGLALPDEGIAAVLHDGIRIYDIGIDQSVEVSFGDADYFVQLAETDDEVAMAPLTADVVEDCDKDCCCGRNDDESCYALGDTFWIPRDSIESRRQVEPRGQKCP